MYTEMGMRERIQAAGQRNSRQLVANQHASGWNALSVKNSFDLALPKNPLFGRQHLHRHLTTRQHGIADQDQHPPPPMSTLVDFVLIEPNAVDFDYLNASGQ